MSAAPGATRMTMDLVPLGDRAVLIRIGDTISEESFNRVRSVVAALDDMHDVEIVPAYASVAVYYDPARASFARMRELLMSRIYSMSQTALTPGRLHEVPVSYGGADGPDLADVARAAGISEEDVVRLHAGAEYTVYMIGFAPGFPYLAGLPPQIAMPRHATPRLVVPAGSVAIGGAQSAIYPLETPGGWRIIGRTSLRLFDATSPEPSLLRVGDRVRFVPRSAA